MNYQPASSVDFADGRLVCGKAQNVLSDIPDDSVDLVLTDPPWIPPAEATTKDRESRGYARNWSDLGTLELAFDAVFSDFARIVKSSGAVMVFCGGASGCVFFPMLWRRFRSCRELIWDKGGGRVNPPFCCAHEKIIYAFQGREHSGIEGRIRRGHSDVLRAKRVAGRERIHPAQKPVDLLEFLIEVASPRGGLVVDPFAGAFSTCTAARNKGRRFFGVEQDDTFFRRAVARFGETRPELTIGE